MPAFDYVNHKFSFQTVFHESYYFYRCCSCAYEHEYMDYITDTGDIDKDMLERVLENIMNGKCPHVDDAPPESINETYIYGIHIAVAIGTEKVIESHMNDILRRHGRIFKQNPLSLALLKNNVRSIELFHEIDCNSRESDTVDLGSPFNNEMFYGTRSVADKHLVKFEFLPSIGVCVRKKNAALLKSVLDTRFEFKAITLQRALEIAFEDNLAGMQENILQCFKKINNDHVNWIYCVESTIIFDQPRLLAQVLKHYKQVYSTHRWYEFSKRMFAATSYLYKRIKCKNILRRHKMLPQNSDHCTLCDKMKSFKRILRKLPDENLKTELKNAIKRRPFEDTYTKVWQPLAEHVHKQSPLCSYLSTYDLKSEVIEVLIDEGDDVDATDSNGNTPLITLISEDRYRAEFRNALEMLVYENSSKDLNKTAVSVAINTDIKLHKEVVGYSFAYNLPVVCVMDGKAHSVYGYDGEVYALNFTAPLLIECGYHVTRDTLLEALDKPLHPAELKYFQQCLDTPRSLQVSCRDALRRKYKGREIHRYVKTINVPGKLADFILLKPVLRTLQSGVSTRRCRF